MTPLHCTGVATEMADLRGTATTRVTDFAESAHSTIRITQLMYTLDKAPHVHAIVAAAVCPLLHLEQYLGIQ